MTGIAEWLASIGLGEYAERFRENAIDLSVVRDLTEQDLKDLGVLLGHRRKMLRAIAELQGEPPRTPRAGTRPAVGETTPGGVNLQSCFAIWSARRHFRPALIWRTCGAVMGTYHSCIAEVVAQNEGVIARYMGDGVLAYFGYPQAHEDDAEQATRAGLALVDAVAKLRTDPATELQVRVGIATGMVVVGDLTGEGSAQEQTVIGETPNLAARLQTVRRSRYRADFREYAPAHRWAFRIPRSRPCRAQRMGGANTSLAGPGHDRSGKPFRGTAQNPIGAANRA